MDFWFWARFYLLKIGIRGRQQFMFLTCQNNFSDWILMTTSKSSKGEQWAKLSSSSHFASSLLLFGHSSLRPVARGGLGGRLGHKKVCHTVQFQALQFGNILCSPEFRIGIMHQNFPVTSAKVNFFVATSKSLCPHCVSVLVLAIA